MFPCSKLNLFWWVLFWSLFTHRSPLTKSSFLDVLRVHSCWFHFPMVYSVRNSTYVVDVLWNDVYTFITFDNSLDFSNLFGLHVLWFHSDMFSHFRNSIYFGWFVLNVVYTSITLNHFRWLKCFRFSLFFGSFAVCFPIVASQTILTRFFYTWFTTRSRWTMFLFCRLVSFQIVCMLFHFWNTIYFDVFLEHLV